MDLTKPKESLIIGETAGHRSTEKKLTDAVVQLTAAITFLIMALGYISPESAEAISTSIGMLVVAMAGVVGAYSNARGHVKAAIAEAKAKIEERE